MRYLRAHKFWDETSSGEVVILAVRKKSGLVKLFADFASFSTPQQIKPSRPLFSTINVKMGEGCEARQGKARIEGRESNMILNLFHVRKCYFSSPCSTSIATPTLCLSAFLLGRQKLEMMAAATTIPYFPCS